MEHMQQDNSPFIFISYSHRDANTVVPIVGALKSSGFNVWYDNGIEAGSEWPEYIAERLMSCSAVVVFMSKNAQDSHNCRREVHFAIELKKDILVVYLDEVELSPGMRLQLGTIQAIYRSKHATQKAFLEHLCAAKLLDRCRTETAHGTVLSEAPKIAFPKAQPAASGNSNTVSARTDREILLAAVEAYNQVQRADGHAFVFKEVCQLTEKQIKNIFKIFPDDGISRDTIVAFLDDTILGNGKSGILLTENALYSRVFGGKFTVRLEHLVKVKSTRDMHITLIYEKNISKEIFFNNSYKSFLALFQVYIDAKQNRLLPGTNQ